MYAAGYGIRPLRSTRPGAGVPRAVKAAIAPAAILLVGTALAMAAHGWQGPATATLVVQPGDTLWSIAAQRYAGDDVRGRIDQIERLNGLDGPVIEVGETLKLPA